MAYNKGELEMKIKRKSQTKDYYVKVLESSLAE